METIYDWKNKDAFYSILFVEKQFAYRVYS